MRGDECPACGYVDLPGYDEVALALDPETQARPSAGEAALMLTPHGRILLRLIRALPTLARFLKQVR